MSNSENLNQEYREARQKLNDARNKVPPNSDEDLEIKAAIDALDLANLNRIQAEYSEGTDNLNSVITKLESVRVNIQANPVSGVLDDINDAIGKVNSLVASFANLAPPERP